ncbi:UNVERIFIED_CONTAM: hypothetical protein KB582_08870 [Streptococcus canis]
MVKTISLSPTEINLDFANPRFSMFEFKTESEIIKYLIQFEQIKELAFQIAENGYITLGERIIILETKEKGKDTYIVLEGNRRVAALKLLFAYQAFFSSAERSKLANMKLDIANFNIECDIVEEASKEAALFKISAKHVEGIKTWSATDKRVFYHNLYTQYEKSGFSKNESLEKINEVTPESKTKVKNAIKELKFLLKIHGITKEYNPSLVELAHLDTDVLVSRVLRPLTKELRLVEGEDFELDSENPKVYTKILRMLGEAVWVTKKLNTRSFSKQNEWEKILNNDSLIPGLKSLIQEYSLKKDEDSSEGKTVDSEEQSGDNKVNVDDLDEKEESYSKKNSASNNNNTSNSSRTRQEEKAVKYKIFVKKDPITVDVTDYDLLKNIELHDFEGKKVSRSSSEYSKIKISSVEDKISISGNKINSLSVNGRYKIDMIYKDKSLSFQVILNIPKKNKIEDTAEVLFEQEWYDESIAKVSSKNEYNQICSVLRNLNNINVITDDEDTYIILAFLIRTLIEYSSRAYWDSFFTKSSCPEKLPALVGQIKGRLLDKKLIEVIEAKAIGKSEDLEALNSKIHNYKTNLSTFDFKTIVKKYKKYLTVLFDEITK